MITYFVRQFLEGDDCAGCGAVAPCCWRERRLAMRGRLAGIRNLEPVQALPQTCRFSYWNCRARPRTACFSASRVAALKTRLENDPGGSQRALVVWGRSMRLAAPICAFDRRLGNAPEWARAEGF